MSEMVERVAKAIEGVMFATHELPLSAGMHANYCKVAEAAIEAMREPTTDMCNAGTRSLALDWNICCDGRIAPDLWQIMIDELLK